MPAKHCQSAGDEMNHLPPKNDKAGLSKLLPGKIAYSDRQVITWEEMNKRVKK